MHVSETMILERSIKEYRINAKYQCLSEEMVELKARMVE
jgi:hypothetical protein